MKKYITLFLTLSLLLLLSACGSQTKSETSKDEKAASKTKNDEKMEHKEGQGSEVEGFLDGSREAIEETVLYDKDGVKIIAKKLQDSEFSVNLDLDIINKSEDFIQINIGDEERSYHSINGMMIDTSPMVTRLEPGQQAVNTLYFNKKDIEALGIKEIAEIGLGMQFFNKDYELLHREFCSIKTSSSSSHDYSKDEFQELYSAPEETAKLGLTVDAFLTESLYDVNGLKHIATVLHTSKEGMKTLLLEFENQSKEAAVIYYSGLSIDGLSLSNAKDDVVILEGKRAILELDLDSGVRREFWDQMAIYGIGRASFQLGQSKIDEFEPGEMERAEIRIMDAEVGVDMTGTEIFNKNGLHIVHKAFLQSSSKDEEHYYCYLAIENKTEKTLFFDVVYESFKVNTKLLDYWCDGIYLKSGETGIMGIKIYEDDMSEQQIQSLNEIKDMEYMLRYQTDDQEPVLIPVKLTF